MRYEEGAYYHAFNRGAFRARISAEKKRCDLFLRLMDRYADRYGIRVTAYCIMPNHFHLLLMNPPGGRMDQFLRSFFSSYVQSVNKWSGSSGTQFESPVKTRWVESEEYFVRVIRYIHRNPVRAHLVGHAAQWKYSDAAEWMTSDGKDDHRMLLRETFFGNGEG